MEQHIIPLNKGVHLTPSVGEEGQLIDCVNLIPKNGSLQNAPVLKPIMATVSGQQEPSQIVLPTGHMLVFKHITSNFSHYITKTVSGTTTTFYYYDPTQPIATGTNPKVILTLDNGQTVNDINAIGNTVIVFANDGMHYLLWKEGAYKYLGTHLPEIAISFTPAVQIKTSEITNLDFSLDGDPQPVAGQTYDIKEEDVPVVTETVMGAVNKLIKEDITDEGYLIHTHLIRYAMRLYDGTSLTMQSAPLLKEGSIQVGGNNGTYEVEAKGWKVRYRFSQDAINNLADWKDIVSSVDIFLSQPIYIYDQSEEITTVYCNSLTEDPKFIINLPADTEPEHEEKITEVANFYLVDTVPVSEIDNQSHDIKMKGKLDTLVNRERMTDDYDSHDIFIPRFSFVYNSRMNIANINKIIFQGFTPQQLDLPYSPTEVAGTEEFIITTTYIHPTKQMVTSIMQYVFTDAMPDTIFFYNPSPYAKMLDLTLGNTYQHVELKQHKYLNGTYAFIRKEDFLGTRIVPEPEPTPEIDRQLPLPNKVYTSEVNNPFFFPLSGINTVGVGEIRGICSAVKALSQGQFGQFPLYVFSTDGIWAMEVNSDGTYSVKQPITRDVCNNPNSITQLDNAVLYATERGLNVIDGSETKLLTAQLEGATEPLTPIQTDYENITRLTFPYSTASNLLAVLGDEGTKISYDGINNIAHVYPSDNNIGHWMLNLDTMEWTRSSDNSPAAFVDGYPNATIQRNEEVTENNVTTVIGKLYEYQRTDISEPHTLRNGFLLTRETALDNPTAMKVLHDLKTMCRFHNYTTSSGTPPVVTVHSDNSAKVIPYVSNDRTKWYRLNSLKGHSWKWYRFALFTNLTDVDTLEGIVLISDLRRTDKLR